MPASDLVWAFLLFTTKVTLFIDNFNAYPNFSSNIHYLSSKCSMEIEIFSSSFSFYRFKKSILI